MANAAQAKPGQAGLGRCLEATAESGEAQTKIINYLLLLKMFYVWAILKYLIFQNIFSLGVLEQIQDRLQFGVYGSKVPGATFC